MRDCVGAAAATCLLPPTAGIPVPPSAVGQEPANPSWSRRRLPSRTLAGPVARVECDSSAPVTELEEKRRKNVGLLDGL